MRAGFYITFTCTNLDLFLKPSLLFKPSLSSTIRLFFFISTYRNSIAQVFSYLLHSLCCAPKHRSIAMDSQVLIALALSLVGGLSTSLGESTRLLLLCQLMFKLRFWGLESSYLVAFSTCCLELEA